MLTQKDWRCGPRWAAPSVTRSVRKRLRELALSSEIKRQLRRVVNRAEQVPRSQDSESLIKGKIVPVWAFVLTVRSCNEAAHVRLARDFKRQRALAAGHT